MRNAQAIREPWMDNYESTSLTQPTLFESRPTPVPLEPIMVPADEACRLLGGIDEKTLRSWRNAGELDGTWIKIGGRVLFDLEALRDWSRGMCARDCFDFGVDIQG